MGVKPPITGNWARMRTVPYTGAAKWGTGIKAVHSYYGSDAMRTYGRPGFENRPDITVPADAVPDFIETEAPWGYTAEDINGLDVFANPDEAVYGVKFTQDDWPSWDDTITSTRRYSPMESYHPWGSPGWMKNILRAKFAGAMNDGFRQSSQLPTETVSTGWRNKPKGDAADSEASADAQIFIQTSDRQRYEIRDNGAAVARMTDDARSTIPSRVVGQKLKIYAGEERHYDMFPFQQDEILRPFRYRTAGVDDPRKMEPNEMYVSTTLQRTPPPDPTTGTPDVDLQLGEFGYTNEDLGYY